jgi:hypothetical protein
MKTISISQRSKSITALLNEARTENLVLTLADGSEFILAEIDAFDHEVKLTRQNQQLMELLEKRAQQPTRVSLAEARRRLEVNGQPIDQVDQKGRQRASSRTNDAIIKS